MSAALACAATSGGKISAMDDSKTLFLSAKGYGSMDIYIGWKADADWAAESGLDLKNANEVLEWFKKEYADWDSTWFELFEHKQTHFVPKPLYAMPLDQY